MGGAQRSPKFNKIRHSKIDLPFKERWMRLTLLVAMDEGRVIGHGNNIPWHLSADLKRFKQITWGHTLIMGRKTFESIGRPLPGRQTIVVTRQPDYHPPGVQVASSISTALELAQQDAEVFIVGGGEIYQQTIARATRLLVTQIHARHEGDAHFPEIDPAHWRRISSERHEPGEKNSFAYTFEEYHREP